MDKNTKKRLSLL